MANECNLWREGSFAFSDCLQSPCWGGFSCSAPCCQPRAAADWTLPSCCIGWTSPWPLLGPADAQPLPLGSLLGVSGSSTTASMGKKIHFSMRLERQRAQPVMCSWWQTLCPIVTVLRWGSVMDSLIPSIFVLRKIIFHGWVADFPCPILQPTLS